MQQGKTTLHLSDDKRGKFNRNDRPRKPFVAKGHDAKLKEWQDRGATVNVCPMHPDSPMMVGVLINRDKFTVTLRIKTGSLITDAEMIIYKHAIESIYEVVEVKPE